MADYQIIRRDDKWIAQVEARGRGVLRNPYINRGTAFTHDQRELLELVGLLPPTVLSLDDQLRRVYTRLREQPNDSEKHVFMSDLFDRNWVLYHRLLREHLGELLPIVSNPTVGEAARHYSQRFMRPRGVFCDIDHPEEIMSALLAYGRSADDVDLLIATDSESVLGLGDQGIGGIAVAVSKMVLYTAVAGIHPLRVLPVVLDTGTDNVQLLNGPGYLGLPHARVRGERYDAFIAEFVRCVNKVFPNAMIHWEDFAADTAHRVFYGYRDQALSYNDDIQGTAAVITAALYNAMRQTGGRISEQRIVLHGAGPAAMGAAALIERLMVEEGTPPEETKQRFWVLNHNGLVTESIEARDYQLPYARPDAESNDWVLNKPGVIELEDVVRYVNPTVVIGRSSVPGAFSKDVVEHMCATVAHPILLPFSQPAEVSEGSIADLMRWSDGKALVASTIASEPITVAGVTREFHRAQNVLVFPGVGLGSMAARPTKISRAATLAVAKAIAEFVTDTTLGAPLLPATEQLREVALSVAEAVVRFTAAEGTAQIGLDQALASIPSIRWEPE
ncbi:MAG: oxaloacetate-decarboxylating malate dehydrogenase, partial [Propionibacteriaceae bacterium]|nr:oxaloacetate-decarboxylating malate dehydrogenase [Propionibacteriaceae bacterium]